MLDIIEHVRKAIKFADEEGKWITINGRHIFIESGQEKVQSISDTITKKYGVSKIFVNVSSNSAKGEAVYNTWKIKGGKINNPKDIVIYDWKNIKNHKGEVIRRLAHEVAHHIANMKKGSLAHSSYHGQLEDEIGSELNKIYE